jgi:NAD(P)-dependent dehydrogenase (short-subunit alcohol dehydrogenase family)
MIRQGSQHRRILITGASRGLGLEFIRQWLARGDRVVALARRPETSVGLSALVGKHKESLRAVTCDVSDDASVERALHEVEKTDQQLDVVVNNAGTYGSRDATLATVRTDDIRKVFEVNTLGPLRVSRAFLPLLRKGTAPRLVHITSLMGSIADNRSGGSWGYRISKTALNMLARNMAIELGHSGVVTTLLHPGWVRTDMGGPHAPLAPEGAVADLIRMIDTLTVEHNGGWFDHAGKPIPW